MTLMRIVAASDKFKGTASAAEVVAAIGRAATVVGASCDEAPMSDGGEGFIDALGGPEPRRRPSPVLSVIRSRRHGGSHTIGP